MASKLVREMSADDLYDRWSHHIAVIADDVLALLTSRARFQALFRKLPKHLMDDEESADALRWLLSLWGTEAFMAVRRELDDQAGVINLRHLLYEIEQRPDVMTRQRFMDRACSLACWCHHPKEKETTTGHFESFELMRFIGVYGDEAHDYIHPGFVGQDRALLEHESAAVFRYAQLLVAHRTPKQDLNIQVSTLNEAIDAIEYLVRKYYLLLNSEVLTPKRVRAPRGWQRTFVKVWNRPPETAGVVVGST